MPSASSPVSLSFRWWPLLVVSLTMTLGSEAAETDARILCWDDASGKRVCGDRLPPEAARLERRVFDPQGRLVDTLPRELSAEERERIDREQRLAAEVERTARLREARDHALQTQYASAQDLLDIGALRLQRLDERRAVTATALTKVEGELAALEADAQSGVEEENLVERVVQYRATVRQQRELLAGLDDQRRLLCAEVDGDIARYGQLTGQPVDGVRLCPQP